MPSFNDAICRKHGTVHVFRKIVACTVAVKSCHKRDETSTANTEKMHRQNLVQSSLKISSENPSRGEQVISVSFYDGVYQTFTLTGKSQTPKVQAVCNLKNMFRETLTGYMLGDFHDICRLAE